MRIREIFHKEPTLKLSLAGGLMVGLLTAIVSLFIPNRYQSDVLVLPKTAGSNSPLASLSAVTGLLAGAGIGQRDEDAQYLEIIKSRWMAERLIDKSYVFNTKLWYFGKTVEHRQTLAAYLNATTPERREDSMKRVLGWVDPKRDLKSGVMHILVETPSRELSQQVADQVFELLNYALKKPLQDTGGAKAAYAHMRLAQVREEEEGARKAFNDYVKTNANYAQSLDPEVRSRGERLALDLALRRQVVGSLTLGVEQAELEARNNVPVMSRLDGAFLPIEKSGPRRANLVLGATFVVSVGLFVLQNRKRFIDRIRSVEADRPQGGAA